MADKFKKIDKEFKLSDSSVNCYGFRLMTSGYQMGSFAVNPIGYYMHGRSAGVTVKWDNLRIDGDSVYGTPVVNLSNARGQQMVDEIEDGFLNAASMGEFVVLEYTDDDALKLPGQTGPTVTKWYNRECSVVDIPGNENALCQLFDAKGNTVTLADLMAGNTPTLNGAIVAGVQNTELNFNYNMKEIKLKISAQLYAALGLDATATAEAIESKLPDLIAKSDRVNQLEIDKVTLATDRDSWKAKHDTLQGSTVKLQVSELLDKAIGDKKITQKLYDLYSKDYATNPTGLKAVLEGHGSYTALTDTINTLNAKAPAGLEGKSYMDLYKDNKLQALKANNKAWYNELHKQQFGTYPQD